LSDKTEPCIICGKPVPKDIADIQHKPTPDSFWFVGTYCREHFPLKMGRPSQELPKKPNDDFYMLIRSEDVAKLDLDNLHKLPDLRVNDDLPKGKAWLVKKPYTPLYLYILTRIFRKNI
jgi:hypothetical protein